MADTTYLDSTELVLNMGPQHPSTHGVLRVVVKLDGERVLGTDCVIGYLHRGLEKIGENRTYAMYVPYVDRADYVAAVSNGFGYCLAVEKLLGVEAPPRAPALRVILAEVTRISSHLVWLGTHCLDIGATTPLMWMFREREFIMDIFERYCGARLTTHAFRIGGLQYELNDTFVDDCRRFCDWVLPRFQEYDALLKENRILVARMKDVGVLPAEDCKAYGVTGPCCGRRASNGICAKRSPTAATSNTSSTFRRATTATRTTATWSAWRKCASRCASSARLWTGCPTGPSWPRCPR
jgi:NADH-quinone oxidoreductase subunit D